MIDKQKTIAKPVTIKGVGLHTGQEVSLTIKPAPINQWYTFVRTDLEGRPEIPAISDYVSDTSRGTSLEKDGARVGTVEHLLAASYGLGLDNLIFELDGPEVPILDGSARYFVEAFHKGGIRDQDSQRVYHIVSEKQSFTNEERGIEETLYPDDEFRLNVLVDYKSTKLVNQYATLENLKEFEKSIARCRTFVFFSELEPLLKLDLIKGGDLDNAIVMVDKVTSQKEFDRVANLFNKPSVKVKTHGVLNNIDLYYNNEPARHKLLDLIGDLALVGMRFKGNIIAKRPGHFANTEMAKIIRTNIIKDKKNRNIPRYNPDDEAVMDVNSIKRVIPHRSPFLFVDKILKLTSNSVLGMKNVTSDEHFFDGHFPEEPIMPGVLQIEAMAQVGGILVLSSVEDPENYSSYFMKLDNVKFRRKVVPGDTLIFELKLKEPIRRGIAQMKGEGYVGSNLACEADLTAQIIKTNE